MSPHCSFKCNTDGDLIKHKIVHTIERPFSCDQCPFTCKQNEHLKQNKLYKHLDEKKFVCPHYSFKIRLLGNWYDTSSFTAMRNPMNVTSVRTVLNKVAVFWLNMAEKTYQCNQCSYKSKKSSTLSHHKKIKTINHQCKYRRPNLTDNPSPMVSAKGDKLH